MQAYALTVDTIKAWAVRKNLPMLENAKLGQLALAHPNNKQIVIRFIPRPERNLMTLAVPLPWEITDEQVPRLLEAISLSNSSTFAGAWTFNHAKREVYFRITVPTIGTGYTDQSVDFLVTIMFGTVDNIGPKLLKVIQGDAPPASILATT